ncbi:MAG: hypothetical protein Q9209_002931 [Squamulea sp. 1 TL-2023]
MLPRFRIRNLQSPLGDPSVLLAQSASGTQSVLISIDTDKYDELVTQCPPAALKYIDDEDGEVVRVGSSLELVQRLDDPVLATPRNRRTTNVTDHDLPSAFVQYHTFDIDRRTDILAMWSNFEDRTCSHSVSDVTDPRSLYFHSTNPPSTKPVDPGPPSRKLDTHGTAVFQHSALTGEGERQAQLAGDLLRARTIPSSSACYPTTEARPTPYQNRWASYSKSPATFVPSISIRKTAPSQDPPVQEIQDVCSAPFNMHFGTSLTLSQVPAAGNKTRGVNLVRRTKSRNHNLDSGAANIRRSSYIPVHQPKFDNRAVDSYSTKTTTVTPGHDTQSSLIEVFNNELKRLATTSSAGKVASSTCKVPEQLSNTKMSSNLSNGVNSQQEEEIVPSLFNRIEDLCSNLHLLKQRPDRGISQLRNLQRGIQAASRCLCTTTQDIADYIQDKSNIEGLKSAHQDETDRTYLDTMDKDLSELLDATVLLKTQMLPFLQDNLREPLQDAPRSPARSMLPDRHSNYFAYKQPSKPNDPSCPDMLKIQQLETSFTRTSGSGERMHFGPSKCQVSKSSDDSINTKPSIFEAQTSAHSALDTHPAVFKASRVEGARPSTYHEHMAPIWADDHASVIAERRFPTLERFEQESSADSPAFRQNPNKRPLLASRNCKTGSDTNVHADPTIDIPTEIATRAPRPYNSRPNGALESLSPMNQGPSARLIDIAQPSLENPYETKYPSYTSNRPTRWRQLSQSLVLPTVDDGDSPIQQDANLHLHVPGPSLCNAAIDMQAQRSIEQGDGADILADATDHIDAATVARTQSCVEQLQKLGFGSAAEGGLNRLVVYAQASGGDLVEAIDLITEERQGGEGFKDLAVRSTDYYHSARLRPESHPKAKRPHVRQMLRRAGPVVEARD